MGGLAGRAQRRGRPQPHHDTWAVARCIRHGVALVTLNTKHYADFVEHEPLVLLAQHN